MIKSRRKLERFLFLKLSDKIHELMGFCLRIFYNPPNFGAEYYSLIGLLYQSTEFQADRIARNLAEISWKIGSCEGNES